MASIVVPIPIKKVLKKNPEELEKKQESRRSDPLSIISLKKPNTCKQILR